MLTSEERSFLRSIAEFIRNGDLSVVPEIAVPANQPVEPARDLAWSMLRLAEILADETPYAPELGSIHLEPGVQTWRLGGKYSDRNQSNPITPGEPVDKNLLKITTPKPSAAGTKAADMQTNQFNPEQPITSDARRKMPYNIIKTIEFEIIKRPDAKKALHFIGMWGGHE